MNKDLAATAYHEAGHAFLAYILGKGFQSVSIIANPEMDYLGAITRLRNQSIILKLIEGTSSIILDDDMIDDIIKTDIIIAYGGYVAELQFNEVNQEGAAADFEFISDLANHHKEGSDSTDLLDQCLEKSKMLIKDNFVFLEYIAKELLLVKEMTYQQFDTFMTETIAELNKPLSQRNKS